MFPSPDPIVAFAILAAAPPLVSFAVIMLFARAHRRLSGAISLTGAGFSLIGAALLLWDRWAEAPIAYTATWFVTSDSVIAFGFLLDPTSLLMLALVALIAFLVQVYSLGYMSGDPGFSRYFAFQSLFAWAMISLTVSSSLLQLYVFWELVGLSSYFLIGFWYEKFSATEAGKKAFVMTRLGDACFFLGILLVLIQTGNLHIPEMNSSAVAQQMSAGYMTLCALLMFGGVVGKSAQFPLLTWLPDAMEGPTPVSALLHSATMVAAGVFLLARLFPFFSQSTAAMTLFLATGGVTLIIASTMAAVDRDIKKIWAFSTVSQLGLMIMAIGAGSHFAGLFHLTTHAAFKALLFLCSGIWIHYFKTNDLFEIAERRGRGFIVPLICLLIAGASLSGIPPFSGFFSKEAILDVLANNGNPLWLGIGLLGVFLTAYYAFRPIFIILFPGPGLNLEGENPAASHLNAHGHEKRAYSAMSLPLIFLAGFTLLLGFLEAPLEDALGGGGYHEEKRRVWIAYASLALALFGLALAWFEFGRRGSPRTGFFERSVPLRRLFGNRWYLDHLYGLLLKQVVYRILASGATRTDRRVIDGAIDAFSRHTVQSGSILSRLQSGLVRHNFVFAFIAITLVILGIYLL